MPKQILQEITIEKLEVVKKILGMRTIWKKVASSLSLKLLQAGNIEKVLRKLTT